MKVYGSPKNTDYTRTSSVTCEKYAALLQRKAVPSKTVKTPSHLATLQRYRQRSGSLQRRCLVAGELSHRPLSSDQRCRSGNTDRFETRGSAIISAKRPSSHPAHLLVRLFPDAVKIPCLCFINKNLDHTGPKHFFVIVFAAAICLTVCNAACFMGLPEFQGKPVNGCFFQGEVHPFSSNWVTKDCMQCSCGSNGMLSCCTMVNIGLLSAALRLVTRCLPWLPGDFGIVGRWRAVCVTALQRPNSDAAAIRIVVGIAAASLNVKGPLETGEYGKK
ncbi:unnamed protein product [Ranitomeya imitator]|uniref:Uncharacterized protein n=1 Tax=Ranitomeya imitator TaxID=111125 RepID=A0ABN9M5Z5_9NEOB|nr:unnamed protein product [Ranitomeya imitator]